MRVVPVLLLLLLPSSLVAQQGMTLPGDVTVEIRSTDARRVLDVRVEFDETLFRSLGVLRPAPGMVSCGPTGCAATTPAVLELTGRIGAGRLSVADSAPELEVTIIAANAPTRRIVAHGHSLSFTRDESGQLSIRAPRITSRF